jgi:hypothetical protein
MTTTRPNPTRSMTETGAPTDVGDLDGSAGVGQTAREIAGAATSAVNDVAGRLPEAAEAARQAVGEADRLLRRSSDDSLMLSGLLTAGFAGGLLIGGAPRLLVIGALLPSIAIAAILADRRGRALRTARPRTLETS